MTRALEQSQLLPEDVGYVNAHATSTIISMFFEFNRQLLRLSLNHVQYLSFSPTQKGIIPSTLNSAFPKLGIIGLKARETRLVQ